MDIYNWDMVCAVSCTDMNKKLKTASREAFGTFSWSDGEGNEISGEFDGWEIVAGGDSQRIAILMPLLSGELTIPDLGKNNVSVNGLCPKLQAELSFVNAGNGDNTTHLKFNLAQVNKKDESVTAGHGSVVVLDADVNHLFPEDESLIPDLYCEMMAEMLVARQAQLAFIFAEVTDIPAGSETSWMKPALMAYAYNEKISGEPGCLAVLATLDDVIPRGSSPDSGTARSAPDQLIFDSTLIREGGSIGFMLSQRMFMKHVVLPGLPGVLEGAYASQFKLDDDNVIRNNGGISLNRAGGYIPWFNSFLMEVIDNRIVINNTSGRCDVGKDRSYNTFELSGRYAPELSVSGGRCSVVLNNTDGPSLNIEIHDTLAKWLWLFGGKRVDALLHQIKNELSQRLFEFSSRMSFDVFPVTFSTDAVYSDCGLADNFYMRD